MSRRLAGFVFDSYDDVDGRVLRSIAPTVDDLPPFVKTAARMSDGEINQTPDSSFALVMLDDGRKLKKFATVDKGNTALSVLYLLKQAHLLPPDAVKIAAGNLVDACQRHGLDVPVHLKMAAHTGFSPVSGKANQAYVKTARKLRYNPKKVEIGSASVQGERQSTDNPTLGQADVNDDVWKRTNRDGISGGNFMKVPLFPGEKEPPEPTDDWREKAAGAFGGESVGDIVVKQKSWREAPYFDMSGWDPNFAEGAKEPPAPERTLLEGSYPVDSYDQVKTASAYFEENWRQFHPRQRHEYCVKLAQRSAELGIEVPEDVQRYGSEDYAADSDMYVEARRGYSQPEFHPGLDVLIEKRAQVNPETFAEALYEFDKLSGLEHHWGSGAVADPWYSTFGPSIEKVAEANWEWRSFDGYLVTENLLEELALNHKTWTKTQFGDEWSEKFAKNPKKEFKALDDVKKRVIAHMCHEIQERL